MSITAAIIAALPAFMAALLACIIAWRGARKVDDLHVVVNSRLTELLEITGAAQRAEGVLEGRASEKAGGDT